MGRNRRGRIYIFKKLYFNNRKLEYSTQREFYSELSRIRAEECIKFGAFPTQTKHDNRSRL